MLFLCALGKKKIFLINFFNLILINSEAMTLHSRIAFCNRHLAFLLYILTNNVSIRLHAFLTLRLRR